MEKGERNVKVEVSLRGVCLYAKCFHLSGDVGVDGGEGRRLWRPRSILTSATVDYKITTLANHSKRLTNTTTEPIILDAEIGNWYLLKEREMIWGKGSFLTPTCSLGKTVFPDVLLFLLSSLSVK